ncbi:DUF2339 domain-containing protein [Spartinivicinus ruber]|uniref:DUF2339 domain-containing protein n=1 Tax=Spartinivicinus ruber TaxID=2683272 RepID=UPI0013D223B6|nr:DUF2339 domain-containing protein [Spartinivicinus ruber]
MDKSAYQAEIALLKKELAELQEQFSNRANQLSARLDTISQQFAQTSPEDLSAQHHETELDLDSQSKPGHSDIGLGSVQQETQGEAEQASLQASIIPAETEQQFHNQQDTIEESTEPVSQGAELTESRLIDDTTDTLENVENTSEEKPNKLVDAFNWLISCIVYIGPFARLIEQITHIYEHYQQQGKTPVFLMTAAGITTLVIGFGYLLQYSFTEFLSFYAKFAVCYLIGIAVSLLGCWLCIKKPAFSEYGSSLIGLGIIIDYLVSYFLGPYFEVVSGFTSFLILAIITLISYVLAITFETKVVATVTLLGGSLSPIVTGDTFVVGHIFALYLLLLTIANLHIAHRINWQILANIALFTTLGLLEYGGYFWNHFNLVSIFFLFSFFYLFSYNWGVKDRQPKAELVPFDLIALNTILFYFIYACFSLPASNIAIGGLLLTNAILITTIFQFFKLRATALGPVVSLMASLQLACALFALMPLDWFGILVGIEGLVLVYLGYSYQAYYLRLEGYFLYGIALLKLISDVVFADWFSTDFALVEILLPLFGLTGLLWCCFKLIQPYDEVQKPFESIIMRYSNEGVSLSAFSSWLIICLTSNVYWLAISSVPLLVWLMWRNQYHQLKLTEWLVYTIPLLCLLEAVTLLTAFTIVSNHSAYYWLIQPPISWINWLCVIGCFSLISQLSRFATFKLSTDKLPYIYQGIAYAIMPVFLGLDVISLLVNHIGIRQYPVINSNLWYNYIINLIIIVIFLYLLIYQLKPDSETIYEKYRLILSEPLGIGLAVFFLYTAASLNTEIWLNLAIIPWAVLLYSALKYKLKVSEVFAWLIPLCFVVAIIQGGIQVGSFHFSDQLLTTKLAWAELFFSGWALPLFYQYINQEQDGRLTKAADIVRIIVYLAIPLIPLPHIYRHYPQFITSAFWFSLAICWGLNWLLKLKQLTIEFYVIFYIATIITIFNALISAVTIFSGATLLNIVAALLSVSLLLIIERPLTAEKLKQSRYQQSFGTSYFLMCFCIAALVYGFTSNIALSMLPALLIMTYSEFRNPLFSFIHAVFRINYVLMLSILLLAPNILAASNINIANIIVLIIYGIIGIFITHKLCYQNKIFWQNYQKLNIQIWVGHGILLLSYLAIIKLLFGSVLAVATTITLLIHALIVLFMTLKEYYRNILKLSLLLFAACTIKLVLYDMQDYSLFHKMLVMIAVGTILLVGAYQFQRMKERT